MAAHTPLSAHMVTLQQEDCCGALTSKLEFTQEEFDAFELPNLGPDSFIQVGARYLQPAGPDRYFLVREQDGLYRCDLETPGQTNVRQMFRASI